MTMLVHSLRNAWDLRLDRLLAPGLPLWPERYSLQNALHCSRHHVQKNTLWRNVWGCSESRVASTIILLIRKRPEPRKGRNPTALGCRFSVFPCSSVWSLSSEPFEKTDTQSPNTYVSSLTLEQFKSQELCVNGTKRNWLWQRGYVLLNYQCSTTFWRVSGMQEAVSLPAIHPPCWCSICRAPGSPLWVCREGTPWNYPLSVHRKGNTSSKAILSHQRGSETFGRVVSEKQTQIPGPIHGGHH